MVFLHKFFVIFTIVLRNWIEVYVLLRKGASSLAHIMFPGYPAQSRDWLLGGVLARFGCLTDHQHTCLAYLKSFMGSAQKDFGQEGHELGWRWARSGLLEKSRDMLEETKWWASTQYFLFTPGQYLPSFLIQTFLKYSSLVVLQFPKSGFFLPTVQWHYFNVGCQLILNIEIQIIFLRSHMFLPVTTINSLFLELHFLFGLCDSISSAALLSL